VVLVVFVVENKFKLTINRTLVLSSTFTIHVTSVLLRANQVSPVKAVHSKYAIIVILPKLIPRINPFTFVQTLQQERSIGK